MADSNGIQRRKDTVLSRILSWSETRPLWLRDALRGIVCYGFPDEQDFREILDLCKKEHGDDTVEIIAEPLSENHLSVDPDIGESVSLTSISKVVGVNQLASEQTLLFGPVGLTIVYGQNGTGKSGYTRILKKACRSRHAGKIMSDIYNPTSSDFATADLSIVRADNTSETIHWESQNKASEILSAITVFDREAASVHIQKKNEVWFRPFGLDIPDDLASVCLEIKARLTSEKRNLEAQRNVAFNKPPWSDRSAFGKALSALQHNTDLEAITPDKPFSDKDETRLAQLQADLAQDPAVAARAQHDYANQINQLAAYLRRIERMLKAESIAALFETKQRADDARAAANTAAQKAFSGLALAGVGEAIWRTLWESARTYSKTACGDDLTFPPSAEDVCVLCHQKIDRPTATRMLGFEEFIKKDTETKATEAAKALDEEKSTFRNLEIHSRNLPTVYQRLKANNPVLAEHIYQYITVAQLVQQQTLAALEGKHIQQTARALDPVSEAVKAEVTAVRSYANSLNDASGGPVREAIRDELAELQDRKRKDEFVEVAQSEIVRLRALQRIEDCLRETVTTAITRLGNEIADDLITPHMRDQFQQEIGELAGGRVRVEVVRSGGKFGSPQYMVKLYTNKEVKIHDVLSEGEQTCVALASYLTELANATHKSALVFDDPVSSLDHRWRARVAKRLAREACVRQVIVFTHDMIFVNDLIQLATECNTPIALAHLTRSQNAVGIVNKDLPWTATSIPKRIDQLEKSARDARKLSKAHEDAEYKLKAASIYSDLRATWERALEDIVFANVIVRHRDYINTRGLKKVTALEEEDIEKFLKGFRKCSEIVNAHDPSRGHDLEMPEPKEILKDIQILKDWSEALKRKMNAGT